MARGDIYESYPDAMMSLMQLGLTSFADMSLDEYKTHALGYRCVRSSKVVGVLLSSAVRRHLRAVLLFH